MLLSFLYQCFIWTRFAIRGFTHLFSDKLFYGRRKYNWPLRLAELLKGEYPQMEGRWAIVTGANSGIGYDLAKQLARCGISVVLACRSDARGSKAEKDIRAEVGECGGKVEYVQLDVCDLKSVTKFANAMQGRGVGLLVCNAGAMALHWSVTPQGFETVFGGHVIGHALLAQLMIPELERSSKGHARIVHVVSCTGEVEDHYCADYFLRPQSPPKWWDHYEHYGQVKCAQMCCAMAMADELGSDNIAIHSLHPGCAQSGIITSSALPAAKMFNWFGATFLQITAEEAASYVLRACLHEDCAPSKGTGKYFHCHLPHHAGPAASDTKVKKHCHQLLQQYFTENGWLPANPQS